ncbi:MAG: hypothetical protein SX243_10135 [Acidobacteriota bacterium]|nr:hypothetical protein [Acidobacteriota bacterium]
MAIEHTAVPKRSILVVGLFLLLTLGIALPSHAYDYRFCFRWPASLADSGFGEDYGASSNDPWRARGGRTAIVANDQLRWVGNLDAAGCSPTLSLPIGTTFDFFLNTSAEVGNGIKIEVRDANGDLDALPILGAQPTILSGATGGVYYYVTPSTPRTTILSVAAFVLQRFNGGISQTTFTLNHRCRPITGGCCNCSSGGEIWLSDFGQERKFIIAHEIGHRLLGKWTGGYENDCDFSAPPGQPCRTSSGHALTSIEFVSCGAMEGWAHFVATDAFNDHQEGFNPDATFVYWSGSGLTVDANRGPIGGEQRYMENVCSPPSPPSPAYTGFGVELDWLRLWWNYHTNPPLGVLGTRPSHYQMMNEIDRSLPWTNLDTYSNLVDGVLAESGIGQQYRFVGQALDNGCAH